VIGLLRSLNDALRDTANALDVAVAEVHNAFMGHGLSVGDPSQADAEPANRSIWYCGAVEPNTWGASEVRAAFWAALVGSEVN
jgi:hypothetical protein